MLAPNILSFFLKSFFSFFFCQTFGSPPKKKVELFSQCFQSLSVSITSCCLYVIYLSTTSIYQITIVASRIQNQVTESRKTLDQSFQWARTYITWPISIATYYNHHFKINLLKLIKESLLIPADTWANINKRNSSRRLQGSMIVLDKLNCWGPPLEGHLGPGGGGGGGKGVVSKCLYGEAVPKDPTPSFYIPFCTK